MIERIGFLKKVLNKKKPLPGNAPRETAVSEGERVATVSSWSSFLVEEGHAWSPPHSALPRIFMDVLGAGAAVAMSDEISNAKSRSWLGH